MKRVRRSSSSSKHVAKRQRNSENNRKLVDSTAAHAQKPQSLKAQPRRKSWERQGTKKSTHGNYEEIRNRRKIPAEKEENRRNLREQDEEEEFDELQMQSMIPDDEEELENRRNLREQEEQDEEEEFNELQMRSMIPDDEEKLDEEEYEEARELARVKEEIPFEELQKLNKLDVSVSKLSPEEKKAALKKEFKRIREKQALEKRTSSMPEELPTKFQVPLRRIISDKKSAFRRDPRFDSLSGKFKEINFNTSYDFLEELRQTEKTALSKELKEEKDPEVQRKLKLGLQILKNQEIARNKQNMRKEIIREWRRSEIDNVRQKGKKPYFLKKSAIKDMEMKKKYENLKKDNKLESYLKKKRKKTAAKERRSLPRQKRKY